MSRLFRLLGETNRVFMGRVAVCRYLMSWEILSAFSEAVAESSGSHSAVPIRYSPDFYAHPMIRLESDGPSRERLCGELPRLSNRA